MPDVGQLRGDVFGDVDRVDVRVGQRNVDPVGRRRRPAAPSWRPRGRRARRPVRSSYHGSDGGTGPPMIVPNPLYSSWYALLVDGLADRLAHVRIGERLPQVVEPEGELAVRRPLVHDVVGILLQRRDELGVDAGEDVDIAGGEGVHRGVGIGEVEERHAADRRRVAPVVVVAREGDGRADVPLLEAERSRAVGACSRGRWRRPAAPPHRGGSACTASPLSGCDSVTTTVCVVGRFDRGDAGQALGLVGALGPLGVQRPHHVGGRQRLAAVERHAVGDRERVHGAVVGDLGQLGQPGLDLAVRRRR